MPPDLHGLEPLKPTQTEMVIGWGMGCGWGVMLQYPPSSGWLHTVEGPAGSARAGAGVFEASPAPASEHEAGDSRASPDETGTLAPPKGGWDSSIATAIVARSWIYVLFSDVGPPDEFGPPPSVWRAPIEGKLLSPDFSFRIYFVLLKWISFSQIPKYGDISD